MQQQLSHKEQAFLKFKKDIQVYEKAVFPSLLQNHGITPEHFGQIVISEVKRNDKLLEAFLVNPSSMYASILAGAEIGLIPNEMNGEFYLIPRNIKQPNGSHLLTVTPLIGYKGLVRILLRGGGIVRINAEVVYESDEFHVEYGLEPKLIHKPSFSGGRLAENIKYAYACCKTRSGEFQFAVLTRDELLTIQATSKNANALYFNDKLGINRWMEKKAALIQLSKLIDKDYYAQKAISLSGSIEGGAYLTSDDGKEYRLVEGSVVRPSRMRKIYDEFAKEPQLLTDKKEGDEN